MQFYRKTETLNSLGASDRHIPAAFGRCCAGLRALCRGGRRLAWGIGWLLVLQIAIGCPDFEPGRKGKFLVRVNRQSVSVNDFNKAFDNAKSSYPQSALKNPELLQQVKLRVLNELTEELLLLERAAELQITLSDSELEAALTEIKKDYPAGVFDQMLLEYAVSYRFWKKRLKVRLLMEKVVAKELGEKIVISPEDIAAYYKKHYAGREKSAALTGDDTDINEIIVRHLRREKAEKAYQSWLKKLRDTYPVEVNEAGWKKIMG